LFAGLKGTVSLLSQLLLQLLFMTSLAQSGGMVKKNWNQHSYIQFCFIWGVETFFFH